MEQLLGYRRRQSTGVWDESDCERQLPSIIITGISEDVLHPLQQRGFIPVYSLTQSKDSVESAIVVKVSPKLYMKTAIELGYPLVDINDCKDSHMARVCQSTLSILFRMREEKKNFKQAWLMQEMKFVKSKTSNASRGYGLVTDINIYYGSKTALLFALQSFLQRHIVAPAVVGAALFTIQFHYGNVDTRYNPVFILFMVIWELIVLRLWHRENATLCFEWGVSGVDELQGLKEMQKVTEYSLKVPWWRQGFTVSIQVLLLVSLLKVMLIFMSWVDMSVDEYGVVGHAPFIAYGCTVWVTNLLFNPVASWLTSFENHFSSITEERNYFFKMFCFHFLNSNYGLFYSTFFLRDIERVKYLLASLVLTATLLDNMFCRTSRKRQCLSTKEKAAADLSNEGKSLLPNVSNDDANEKWKSLVTTELTRPKFCVNETLLGLSMRYCHLCMFAVAWPLAPLVTLLFNALNNNLYLEKLKTSIRTPVMDTSSLSYLLDCIKFINFVAIVVNCFILCLLTSDLDIILPKNFESIEKSETQRFLLMIFLEHVIVLFEVILSYCFENTPQAIKSKISREKIEEFQALVNERLVMYQLLGKTKLEEKAREHDERAEIAYALDTKYSSHFGYNPYLLLGVVIVPLMCANFGVSQFIFFPICILFFSYLKNAKDRNDMMTAAGIISDKNVLRYIQQEMPAWISSSDVERAMWLDATLQTLWPNISKASEEWLVECFEPYLKASSMMPDISIKDMKLGSVSPRVTGIRNIRTSESIVRLDVELVWAGTPEVWLEVGKNLNLEMRKIFMSCKLRVELGPLVSVYPSFGAVSLSFVGKPKIDFSFKVGGVDIMNFGVASTDYSVAMVVGEYIKSSLDYMVYPKKYVIPMVEDVNIDKLLKVVPVGILKLTILSAKDLVPADFIAKSSDPYVVIKFMESKYKTRIVHKNLCPIWNERFDLMIYDKETQHVLIEVFDYDFSTKISKGIAADDFLGRATLNLDRLRASHSTEMQLKLSDTKSGVLNIICEYCPLKKNGKASKSSDEYELGNDILFNFTPGAFATDILNEEPTPLYVSSDDASQDSSDESNNRNSFSGSVLKPPFPDASTPLSTSGSPLKPGRKSVSDNGRKSIHGTEERYRRLSQSCNRQSYLSGVLSVSNMKCRNLKKSSRNMTRSLRPYVAVSLENQTKRTESKRKLRNPIFEETFNFFVASSSCASVQFRILNEFAVLKDVLIGQCFVDLIEVQASGKVEKEFILDGNTDTRVFCCTLEWIELE